MPEGIDSQQAENIERITSEAKPWMNDQIVKGIVEKDNEELIGNGAECIVINKKGNPDLVVAFDYAGIKNIEEQKVQFYWHRIYSVLFPHNFPRFYSVWATEKSSGTIRRKIDCTDKPAQVNYPFGMVRDLCREFDLPLWVDRVSSNFTVGRDGGEYYLDQPTTLRYPNAWNKGKVLEFMQKNGNSEEEKQSVLKYIERLNQIESTKKI